MITALRLKNFKNFADETLRMGPFTVIVGANASGKSNIRDAFRFLHGVGRGYRLADIVGGKYGAGGQVEWAPIRGAADEIIRLGKSAFSLSVQADANELVLKANEDPTFSLEDPTSSLSAHALVRAFKLMKTTYMIEVSKGANSSGFGVIEEELIGPVGKSVPYTTTAYTSQPPDGDPILKQRDDTHLLLRMAKTRRQRKIGDRIAVRPDQPALTQIQANKTVGQRIKQCANLARLPLIKMRFLDPSPKSLRQPAFPGQTVLGDSGENLPTVLQAICEDHDRRASLLEWTRELTPMDIRDFEFVQDQTSGRIQLLFREASGKPISAYSASDGTLRFLAMLAALLSENSSGLYVFEEIDNGIHPSRLRLLLDLIETRTAKGDIQVVTTTHSSELLSMISDETFKHTSVVCRTPDTDDAVMRAIAELPNAEELRKTQGLGRLHTGGWLENAVWFSQAENQDEDNS